MCLYHVVLPRNIALTWPRTSPTNGSQFCIEVGDRQCQSVGSVTALLLIRYSTDSTWVSNQTIDPSHGNYSLPPVPQGRPVIPLSRSRRGFRVYDQPGGNRA